MTNLEVNNFNKNMKEKILLFLSKKNANIRGNKVVVELLKEYDTDKSNHLTVEQEYRLCCKVFKGILECRYKNPNLEYRNHLIDYLSSSRFEHYNSTLELELKNSSDN